MTNLNKYYEVASILRGTQDKKDVKGWGILHEFDNNSENKAFDARVYQRGNRIIIAFAGTELKSGKDDLNDLVIMNKFPFNDNIVRIPSQYGDAERLYNTFAANIRTQKLNLWDIHSAELLQTFYHTEPDFRQMQ